MSIIVPARGRACQWNTVTSTSLPALGGRRDRTGSMCAPSRTRLLQLGLLALVLALCNVQAELGTNQRSNLGASSHEDKHGGIPMGIPNDDCDNGWWHLEMDWDNSSNYEYTCQQNEALIPPSKVRIEPEPCLPPDNIPWPLHVCMTNPIQYNDLPPRGGPHRPLWPVFGEYLFVPPQRWLHSLEHGAAAFLYHPCADPDEVALLRTTARLCLRKHILTPYRNLTRERPYAVVTYGCRLQMSYVDKDAIKQFVKAHAMTAPESSVLRDGDYSFGLKQRALYITDEKDSVLCPDWAESGHTADDMVYPYEGMAD